MTTSVQQSSSTKCLSCRPFQPRYSDLCSATTLDEIRPRRCGNRADCRAHGSPDGRLTQGDHEISRPYGCYAGQAERFYPQQMNIEQCRLAGVFARLASAYQQGFVTLQRVLEKLAHERSAAL